MSMNTGAMAAMGRRAQADVKNKAMAAEDDLRDQAGREANAIAAAKAQKTAVPPPPKVGPASPTSSTPAQPQAQLAPDYSGVINDIKSGYDAQRQKAAASEGRNLQSARDAIDRRAAQLGGGPSGAMIAIEQNAENDSAQRVQQANADISQAQNQDLRGVQMTKLGQEFQAGQQQAGINAQKELADKQIQAQALMQKYGLDAQKAMQLVGIGAQKDLQSSAQSFQGSEAQKARDLQVDQFAKTFDMQGKQFDWQKQVDEFNMKIAEKLANKKDMLERGLGPLSPSGEGKGGMSGLPSFMDSWFSGMG